MLGLAPKGLPSPPHGLGVHLGTLHTFCAVGVVLSRPRRGCMGVGCPNMHQTWRCAWPHGWVAAPPTPHPRGFTIHRAPMECQGVVMATQVSPMAWPSNGALLKVGTSTWVILGVDPKPK